MLDLMCQNSVQSKLDLFKIVLQGLHILLLFIRLLGHILETLIDPKQSVRLIRIAAMLENAP